ncbi:mitochondrial inner membrane protease subunit 2-like [Pollicipes pollicipes]|uniref:mitochondrial inner membrane protease subunit 2-like n=1 Tax=Pollicipes pollicipes TaxID=41117 RepID=UPI001884E130|nr:mitochondrial inner membrane protease subunit 2-like [Pollicipes pollicipes]
MQRLTALFRTVVISVPIGITLVDVFGYVAKVEGSSMQPALNPDGDIGDYVFLNRWAVRHFQLAPGAIVSLSSPKDPDQKLIKRVVGLEGDVVRTLGYRQPVVRVPDGHCWVEGDNRGHSLDSNLLGPVAVGLVTARASHVVWPPRRWRRLEPQLPADRHPLSRAASH